MASRISPLCATFKRRKRPLDITHVTRYPRTRGQGMRARQPDVPSLCIVYEIHDHHPLFPSTRFPFDTGKISPIHRDDESDLIG